VYPFLGLKALSLTQTKIIALVRSDRNRLNIYYRMSRLINNPITIPDGVDVVVDGGEIQVSGENGELTRPKAGGVSVAVTEAGVDVSPESADDVAMAGTVGSHIRNMITGVTDGFQKKLEFEGVGYRADVSGGSLNLEMGYSHEIDLDIPDGLDVSTESETITVSGPDKAVVGQFAATVRSVREPEPYQGSGIQYVDETIRRKEGKTAV
jgi:large subunit ribosomal protein L6